MNHSTLAANEPLAGAVHMRGMPLYDGHLRAEAADCPHVQRKRTSREPFADARATCSPVQPLLQTCNTLMAREGQPRTAGTSSGMTPRHQKHTPGESQLRGSSGRLHA